MTRKSITSLSFDSPNSKQKMTEQWEALIIESNNWLRTRVGNVIDSVDMESIESRYISEFEALGGMEGNLKTMDIPLARFVRLFYTDEFKPFVRKIMNREYSDGICRLGDSVSEILYDQMIRYFVFVEANQTDAIRFAQLITGVAVLRNGFDDESMKFLQTGLVRSRQRFFKVGITSRSNQTEYSIVDKFNLPVSYPTPIANYIRENYQILQNVETITSEFGILDPMFITEVNKLQLLDPLKIIPTLYSPVRSFVMHVMYLLAMYGYSENPITVLYFGKAPSEFFVPLGAFKERVANVLINPANWPNIVKTEKVIVMIDLEPTDSQVQQLFQTIRRESGNNLRAVSFNIEARSVPRFKYPGGRLINTPWRNPFSKTMKLVWEPRDYEMEEYSSSELLAIHKLQDYVKRPLFKYLSGGSFSHLGYIDGEFDTELERYIIGTFSLKFRPQFVDLCLDLIPRDLVNCPPRNHEKPMTPGELMEMYRFIIDQHLDVPGNPIINDVMNCRNYGVYPIINHGESEHNTSIEKFIGGNNSEFQELTANYLTVSETRRNIISMMYRNDIFPLITHKESIVRRVKEIIGEKKLLDLVRHEPGYRNTFINQRFKDLNIIVLGDTLGNIIRDVISVTDGSINIYYEGTFSMSEIWDYISDNEVNLTRLKNIFELKNYVNKSFIIIEGQGYPENIANAVVEKYSNMDSYVGRIVSGLRPEVFLKKDNNEEMEMINTISEYLLRTDVRRKKSSCLFLGADRGYNFEYLPLRDLIRLDLTVTTSKGGKDIYRKLNSITTRRNTKERVIYDENLSYIPEVEKYDVIYCDPSLFSIWADVESGDAGTLIQRISNILSPSGVFKTLHVDVDSSMREDYSSNWYKHENKYYKQVFTQEIENICKHLGLEYYLKPVEESNVYYNLEVRKVLIEQPVSTQSYEGVAIRTAESIRRFNNNVKRSLIDGIKDKAVVLDLACGHGQDMDKWFRNRATTHYLGIDGSSLSIKEANNRLRARTDWTPASTKFMVEDVFTNVDWVVYADEYSRGRGYSAVSCQLALHYAFDTEQNVKTFLYHVADLLQEGGQFVISTIDSETLIDVIRKYSKGSNDMFVVNEKFFKIEVGVDTWSKIENENQVTRLSPGVSYDFTQFPDDPKSRKSTEYIVDPYFLETWALSYGLVLKEKKNFLEYSNSNRDLPNPDERLLSGLYCTYKFEKIGNIPKLIPEFKLSESERLYTEVIEHLTSNTIPESCGKTLIVGPEFYPFHRFITKNNYSRLIAITEDIDIVSQLGGDRIFIQGNLDRPTKLPGEKFNTMFIPGEILGNLFRDYRSLKMYMDTLEPEFTIYTVGAEYKYDFNNYIFDIQAEEDDSFSRSGIIPRTWATFSEEELKNEGLQAEIVVITPKPDFTTSQAQMFRHFRVMKIRKITSAQDSSIRALEEEMTALTVEPVVETPTQTREEEPIQRATVDKFVLFAKVAQKKKPGMGRGESLISPANIYNPLHSLNQSWRQMLSDDWVDTEIPIRMATGEEFSSVSNALLYYKNQFAGIEGYEVFDLTKGLQIPSDIKIYERAIRGKKGEEWKQRQPEILNKIYEAKFTNRRFLEILLATRDAELYSSTTDRNLPLETIRSKLRNIQNSL